MAEQIARISEALQSSSTPPSPVAVRELLNWYGAKRRGENVVARIRADLDQNKLITKPDFESAWIGGNIVFELLQPEGEASVFSGGSASETGGLELPGSDGSVVSAATISPWVANDPTHQLSKLQAANQSVLFVSPNDTISVAVTKMLLHDYSQLPVMTNERNVKGVVSWKSLGTHLILGREGGEVRHAMNAHHELVDSASIFEAISVVSRHDYVLVKDYTGKITGIVTASDLTDQFRSLSGPFLILGEIENHLRNMIAEKFGLSDFETVRDPNDLRTITNVADLTFGEYARLLEPEDNWSRFGLNLDRAYFCGRLEVVRKTRNDVMHFDPDGIDPEQLQALEEFLSALRTIQGR